MTGTILKGHGGSGVLSLSVALLFLVWGLGIPVHAAPPLPVEVTLEDAHKTMSFAPNTSGTALLNGTVQTTYPGLEVTVDFSVTCKGATAQVSPSSMTLRGAALDPFMIIVLISSSTTNGTVLHGTLVYTVLSTYPGGSAAATSSESFDITVLRYDETNGTTKSAHKGPAGSASSSPQASLGLVSILFLVLVVLSIILYSRRNKGSTPRIKMHK